LGLYVNISEKQKQNAEAANDEKHDYSIMHYLLPREWEKQEKITKMF